MISAYPKTSYAMTLPSRKPNQSQFSPTGLGFRFLRFCVCSPSCPRANGLMPIAFYLIPKEPDYFRRKPLLVGKRFRCRCRRLARTLTAGHNRVGLQPPGREGIFRTRLEDLDAGGAADEKRPMSGPPGTGRILEMRTRSRKVIAAISVLSASGFLTSGPGTSCSSYVGESALIATDFCFIFDCQNGILGGTIDPCTTQGPLFTDCLTNQGP